MSVSSQSPEHRRKHIMFLVSSMRAGGAERVASLLSNHWVRSGHRVTLVPTFSERGECDFPLEPSVQLDYLADHIRTSRLLSPGKLRRLLALRRLVRSVSPDVIVSFLTHVNVAAIIASLGLKIPVVVSERTYPPAAGTGIVLSQLRKLTYPRARAVIMLTETGLDWLKVACRRAKGSVIGNPVLLPLPVAEPIVEPQSIVADARRLILGVGRLGEEKGFTALVTSFSMLAERYPDWDLAIIGEGDERRRLESMVDRLGLNRRVHLPGRIGNLADWYLRADVFALTSRFEGFPNVLLEAMSHGLPAVSFDCLTGPSSIIRDQVDGILVSPDAGIRGFTTALESLLADASKRSVMSRAALEVTDRFSVGRVARSWDQVLRLDETGQD